MQDQRRKVLTENWMCVHRLASSFVCDLVMEEDQGYGGDKPTAGQGSSDLGEARKPAISTFASLPSRDKW